MRRVLGGLAALICVGAGHADPSAVQFPGLVQEVRAPNADMRVTYFDPGENQYQIHEYSLRLEYPGGRSDEIHVFTRSVEISWSPSGEAFYVTDFIGSDVADCFVLTPGPEKTQKISLTDVVTQGRFPAAAWALQHSAHGYVGCDAWSGPDKLHFVVEGAGGDSPRGFHYAFEYDLKRGVAKQVRQPSRKPSR